MPAAMLACPLPQKRKHKHGTKMQSDQSYKHEPHRKQVTPTCHLAGSCHQHGRPYRQQAARSCNRVCVHSYVLGSSANCEATITQQQTMPESSEPNK
eukprot:6021416-Amphidinium_carterae.1